MVSGCYPSRRWFFLPMIVMQVRSGQVTSGQVRSGQVLPATTIRQPAIKRPMAGRLAETHTHTEAQRGHQPVEKLPDPDRELGMVAVPLPHPDSTVPGRSAPGYWLVVGAHSGPSDSMVDMQFKA